MPSVNTQYVKQARAELLWLKELKGHLGVEPDSHLLHPSAYWRARAGAGLAVVWVGEWRGLGAASKGFWSLRERAEPLGQCWPAKPVDSSLTARCQSVQTPGIPPSWQPWWPHPGRASSFLALKRIFWENFHIEELLRGWRNDSVVKSTCCSCKGPGFCSHHQHAAHNYMGT